MLARFKVPRDRVRSFVRSALLWLAAGCVGAILVTVLAEFFVKWAEEAGWYSHPSQRAGRVMSAIGWFLTSAWFIVPTVFISGLAAGAWLDWLLRWIEKGRPITVRALARVLDDFHAEGTPERNRLIPSIADFDYQAERAKLVAWKERVLQTLNVDHIAPAEFSSFRTLRDFEGWAHEAPNKSTQQGHIEAMWNEHLSRLQSIIYRLSGLPLPPAVTPRVNPPPGDQFEKQRLAEHAANVRAELAEELSQIGVQAIHYEWRENLSAVLATNRALELITQLSYDEVATALAREYINLCQIIASKRQRHEDDRGERAALSSVSKQVFKLLHRS